MSNNDSNLHIPVLFQEVLQSFSNLKDKGDLRLFDGTFGRGGHFTALFQNYSIQEAVVMDQDRDAIEYAQQKLASEITNKKIVAIHDNFCHFSKYKLGLFDIMLLDLGVSSPQLDQAQRGFSFYHDGPLDMRMNQSQTLKAETIINTYSEDELNELFQTYGEVRRPFRVTRAIVHDRKKQAFTSTQQLASLIERVDGWFKKGFHPATQYFMALRLSVNAELAVIDQSLLDMMKALKPEGRLAVITFHSLEDRIVKNIFRSYPDLGQPVFKKVITPSEQECEKNPRARSAKLRIFARGHHETIS